MYRNPNYLSAPVRAALEKDGIRHYDFAGFADLIRRINSMLNAVAGADNDEEFLTKVYMLSMLSIESKELGAEFKERIAKASFEEPQTDSAMVASTNFRQNHLRQAVGIYSPKVPRSTRTANSKRTRWLLVLTVLFLLLTAFVAIMQFQWWP